MLQYLRFQCKSGRPHRQPRLKHERQRPVDVVGLQLCLACPVECIDIWAMTRHAVMQAGAARHKALRLGVVLSENQPHELVHHVAVKPGRTKGMLRNHPARRKNHKVHIRRPCNSRGRCQDGKDRRVGMIEAHCVDALKARHVVLVRSVVTVPCNYIERRVIDFGPPQPPQKLGDHLERAFPVFVIRNRRKKVTSIGEAICSNGPQIGKSKALSVVLADITTSSLVG